jgi:ketosteroid isomerase-like protein
MKYSLILIAALAAAPLCAAPPADPRPPGAAEPLAGRQRASGAAAGLQNRVATPPDATGDKAAIEKAVLAADDLATAAGQARDADRLIGCMAENDKGSVVMNGVVYLTREDTRKSVAGNFRAVSSVEYRWKTRLVTVLSPDSALVVSEGESAVTTAQGSSFTAPFVQTAVWVRRGGEWKILHAHQSSPRR